MLRAGELLAFGSAAVDAALCRAHRDPLVEGLTDIRVDVRFAFDQKAGETLTVVFDVTLGMRGTPAKSPSAERTAKWERACMAPCLVHSSVLQSHWAKAPLWVCISTAGVVKCRMMNPARFRSSRKRSIIETGDGLARGFGSSLWTSELFGGVLVAVFVVSYL